MFPMNTAIEVEGPWPKMAENLRLWVPVWKFQGIWKVIFWLFVGVSGERTRGYLGCHRFWCVWEAEITMER